MSTEHIPAPIQLPRLWEVKHPYYMNEGNYYQAGCHTKYDNLDPFLAEWGESDQDYNWIVRWDWIEGDGSDDWQRPAGRPDTYMDGRLKVQMIGQRKALLTSYEVRVCRYDEPRVRAFLDRHAFYMRDMWQPFNLSPPQSDEEFAEELGTAIRKARFLMEAAGHKTELSDHQKWLMTILGIESPPTMTDLMVATEGVEAFMEANPLPPEHPPEQPPEIEALVLAANRLAVCVLDHSPGTREFIRRSEWAREAQDAVVALRQRTAAINVGVNIPGLCKAIVEDLFWNPDEDALPEMETRIKDIIGETNMVEFESYIRATVDRFFGQDQIVRGDPVHVPSPDSQAEAIAMIERALGTLKRG